MSIVYQYDKRFGVTYAYENIKYIDEVTGKPKYRRKIIGRVADLDTKEIVPTGKRGRKPRTASEAPLEEPDMNLQPQLDYEQLYKETRVLLNEVQSQNRALQEALNRTLRKQQQLSSWIAKGTELIREA